MMKRNARLILGIAAAAPVLLLIGMSRHADLFPLPATASETPGEESAYSDAVTALAESYLAEYPADSYLLLTTASGTRMPIPLNEDNAFRISQADGSENVVHIGKDSFFMESSNCENQTCVQEGEVTLANRDTRVLLNMVICLPHNIRLELVTREEAKSFLLQALALEEESAGRAGE